MDRLLCLHIVGAPLFEVFSVTIHGRSELLGDGKPCEIYGIIRVTHENGAFYDLYSRSKDDPELVSLGGTLSLTGEHCGIVSLSSVFKVNVDLKDKARDIEIAKGVFDLTYETIDDFDDVKVNDVHGEHGNATLRCTTFKCANFVKVEFILNKPVQEGGDAESDYVAALDVYGDIVAYYGSSYKFSIKDVSFDDESTDTRKEYLSMTLFSKKREESVRVKYGTAISLSRSLVCVPLCSTLILEVNLFESGSDSLQEVVVNNLELSVYDPPCIHSEYIEGRDYQIKVNLEWGNAYTKLEMLTRILQYMLMKSPKDISHTDMYTIEKLARSPELLAQLDSYDKRLDLLKFISYLQSPLVVGYQWLTPNRDPMGYEVVQVFSVVFFRDKCEVSDVYGTVKMGDTIGDAYIINRDASSSSEGPLSITWPNRSFELENFNMVLRVNDGDGREISKGYMMWNELIISGRTCYFHRRVASFVQGAHGFAMVHFVMLLDAFQAKLEISLGGKDGSQIHGKIIAYYDDFGYSSCYEKRFYRAVLFARSAENYWQLSHGLKMPLLRSVFAVPVDANLVVKFRLWVTTPLGTTVPIRESISVKGASARDSTQKLCINEGQSHPIEVFVECRRKCGLV